MRNFILYVVLLALFSLVAAQSHIAYGGFQRLLPVTSTNVACWDATRRSWKRDDAFFLPTSSSNVVPLSDTEAYFHFPNSQAATASSAQIFYATQATHIPVLGNKGVFLQVGTTSISFGSFTTMLVNKARTRLWVIGTFTRIGSTSITQLSNSLTIAAFDISNSKSDPTLLTIPAPPATMQSLDTGRVFTQGDTLLIYATEAATGQSRMYRITIGTGWTAVTDSTQSVSTINFKVFPGDETLFAYGSNDVLSNTRPTVANPTYQRLAPGANTWSVVATNVQPVNEVTRAISPTQWVPVSNSDVVFVIAGSTITGVVTNAQRDQQSRFLQYFYRASGNTITLVDTAARIGQSPTTASNLVNMIGNLVYDDVSKVVMIEGGFSHIIKGDYQSPFADTNTGLITEDRSKYIVKRLITANKMLLRLEPSASFDNFFGGSTTASAAQYFTLPTGATQTCFVNPLNSFTSYNLAAPLIAAYNDSQWISYPNLNFDSDAITGSSPAVNVIERVGTTAAFFVGGNFRSIEGTVYNSIVKYNADKTISALGTGVSVYTRNGDGAVTATNPSDANMIRYYDTAPGSVNRLLYDDSRKVLYVAGTFQRAGSANIRNFAQYNETSKTWSSVGKVGVSGGVSKMVLFNDYLIVGGSFSRVENFTANNIAMFNQKNNTWEPMGQGLSFTDMIVYNGQLFVSGLVNGKRQGAAAGTSSTPSLLSVWNPISRTFSPLSFNNLQDLGTTTCSISAVCDPTISGVGALIFQVANGRLYAVSANSNGLVYRWNGNNFDFVYQQTGNPQRVFIRNGIQEGSRTIAYNQGASTFIYQDFEANNGAWQANWDRTDGLGIADAVFTDLVSSGFKIQFNIVLLAVVALFGLLFA